MILGQDVIDTPENIIFKKIHKNVILAQVSPICVIFSSNCLLGPKKKKKRKNWMNDQFFKLVQVIVHILKVIAKCSFRLKFQLCNILYFYIFILLIYYILIYLWYNLY